MTSIEDAFALNFNRKDENLNDEKTKSLELALNIVRNERKKYTNEIDQLSSIDENETKTNIKKIQEDINTLKEEIIDIFSNCCLIQDKYDTLVIANSTQILLDHHVLYKQYFIYLF